MVVAAALAAGFLVLAAGVASADPSTPAPAPPVMPRTAMDQAGTYAIGTDIVAGTYVSAGPVEGDKCYWKRVGGDDGKTTLDNAMSAKPQVVWIDPTDTAFKTNGCQPWHLTDAPPPGDTPPWLSQLQLRHYLDVLNGLAGQSGNGQLPPS
ncbi:hypothetical protein [Candidatus Mycolicibacterium alkanivorans]